MEPGDKEMKDCQSYEELVSAYLDDELSATELLELSGHLKSCQRCSRQMEELFSLKNALHQAEPFWPKPAPSETFMPDLMKRLTREADPSVLPPVVEGGRISRWRLPIGLPSLAAAAMAAIMIFAGSVIYYQSRRQTILSSNEAQEESLRTAYLVSGNQEPDDLEEYLLDHALGSSQDLLLDNEDQIEFVNYDVPQ